MANSKLGVAQDGDRTPHLCIDIGGHTAPVQTLAFTPDSAFLCSGGLDKAVRVWPVPPLIRAVDNDRFRSAVREDAWNEVTILRWEVGRGLRGNIHAIAASPTTGHLAVGGYGARGAHGRLGLVQLRNGGTASRTVRASTSHHGFGVVVRRALARLAGPERQVARLA